MRAHIPFRKWRPCGVGGKCVSGAHSRSQKTDDELEREVFVVSVDHTGPKSSDDRSDRIDSILTLIRIELKKWVFAHVVPCQGLDAHALEMMNREI